MAEPKTKVNKASVAAFLSAIPDEQVRRDCRAIAEIMKTAAKAPAEMWGTAIVGFGRQTTVYADGREADWPTLGFAARKQNIAIYGLGSIKETDPLMKALGTHGRAKSCLYIKRLSDVHLPTFKKVVRAAVGRRAKAKRS